MSKSKLSVGMDIRDILVLSDALKAYIGTNVFPLVAPEDTEGDFIIFARTNYGSQLSLMGVADEYCEITYNIVSSNYLRGVEIAEVFRNLLQDITVDKEPLYIGRAREDYVGEGNLIKYVQILPVSIGMTPSEN